VPLNRVSIGFTLSDLPEFCGPGNLADCIISIRNNHRERFNGWGTAPISDEGIRRLINLAYHTSMVPEEGRFPMFRVACHPKDGVRAIAECDVALDSVERLRRLAPAVSGSHSVALLVTDDTGPLRCIGLAIVDSMGFGVKPGRPEIGGVGFGPTFYLRVEGPGQLRASDSTSPIGGIRLSGARIHQVAPYDTVPGVRKFLEKLAARTLDSVVAAKGDDSRKWFSGHTYPLVAKVLARILENAIDLQHGGAFAFLPTLDRNVDAFDIHFKYPAALNLGHSITDFWCACVDWAEGKDEKERESALHHWRWKRERLFSSATALSGLSAVDGCVVLNHNLDVLGFGGVIGLGDSDKKIVESPRKLKNAKTGAILEDSEIVSLDLGTRHRSAFRLCKAHADSLVFVISQDGDLRVFFSDDKFVYGFEHLFAWVNELDAV
jgi:hypothetical protein